jgi:hypothetical protein
MVFQNYGSVIVQQCHNLFCHAFFNHFMLVKIEVSHSWDFSVISVLSTLILYMLLSIDNICVAVY